MDETRIPILVGSGQVTQREPDPTMALSPMDLTAASGRKAAEDSDAGAALLKSLDTIVLIRSFSDTSWRFTCPFGKYTNPPLSLANRLGLENVTRHIYTYPGGNMPQWSVNRMFEMITRGEMEAGMIAGGEALATQKSAQRADLNLDWNEDPGGKFEEWGVDKRGWSDIEDRHRMTGAIFAYPMFENAIRVDKGRSIHEHSLEIGRFFSNFASVAANNPLADRRQGFTPKQISTVSSDNPYIGFPYTKLMNSNAFIDQSAAIILTSVAKAKKHDFVGEIAILCDVPRTATVRAITDVTVLRISKELFFRLVREFPEMAVQIMRELAARVERTNSQLARALGRASN